MDTLTRSFRTSLVVCTLLGALVSQQYSSQRWTGTPPAWATATETTYYGDSVTNATEDNIDYWVVWLRGVKVYRVRKDDPSLSQGEKDRFKEAVDGGKGVEVETTSSPEVKSVTVKP